MQTIISQSYNEDIIVNTFMTELIHTEKVKHHNPFGIDSCLVQAVTHASVTARLVLPMEVFPAVTLRMSLFRVVSSVHVQYGST